MNQLGGAIFTPDQIKNILAMVFNGNCSCTIASLIFERYKSLECLFLLVSVNAKFIPFVNAKILRNALDISEGILRDCSPSGICLHSRVEEIVEYLLKIIPNRILIPTLALKNDSRMFKRWLYASIAEYSDGVETFISIFKERKHDLGDRIAAVIMEGGKFIDPGYYFPRIFQQLRQMAAFLPSNANFESQMHFEVLNEILARICQSFSTIFEKFFLEPIIDLFRKDYNNLSEYRLSALLNITQNLFSGRLGSAFLEKKSFCKVLFEASIFSLLELYCYAQESKNLLRNQLLEIIKSLFQVKGSFDLLKNKLSCYELPRINDMRVETGSDGGLQTVPKESESESLVDEYAFISYLSDILHNHQPKLEFLSLVIYLAEENVSEHDRKSDFHFIFIEKSIANLLSTPIELAPLEALKFFNNVIVNSKADAVISLSIALINTILSQGALSQAEVYSYGKETLSFTLLSKCINHNNLDISQPSSILLQLFDSFSNTLPFDIEEQDILLRSIMEELSSSDEMHRAYGVKRLGEYLKSPNSSNLGSDMIAKLYALIEKQVHDPETFISGLAIKTLSSLVEIYPEIVIPSLISKYKSLSLLEQTKVKLAETISQAIQNMGLTIYQYKPLLIRSLLDSINPLEINSPVVRKSAFSALSDSIEALGYGIHEYIVEIFDVIICALSDLEQDWEVKNSALYLSYHLIQKSGHVILSKYQYLIHKLYESLHNLSLKISTASPALPIENNIESTILEIHKSIEKLILQIPNISIY